MRVGWKHKESWWGGGGGDLVEEEHFENRDGDRFVMLTFM